jgi:hypothetical protein
MTKGRWGTLLANSPKTHTKKKRLDKKNLGESRTIVVERILRGQLTFFSFVRATAMKTKKENPSKSFQFPMPHEYLYV